MLVDLLKKVAELMALNQAQKMPGTRVSPSKTLKAIVGTFKTSTKDFPSQWTSKSFPQETLRQVGLRKNCLTSPTGQCTLLRRPKERLLVLNLSTTNSSVVQIALRLISSLWILLKKKGKLTLYSGTFALRKMTLT